MTVSLGTADGVLLESATQHATLGIRFWDAALDVPIANELQVSASAVGSDFRPVRAKRSLSGVYVFHALSGLGALERPGTGKSGPTAGSVAFNITVFDPSGEFSPMVFGIGLPLAYRGLFLEADPTQRPNVARMYLFSARTRKQREGLASIACDVWDRETAKPAAFAVVAVTLSGETRCAIADEQGRALVLFPWPASDRLQLGSPPGWAQGSIYGQSWPITLAVRYSPSTLVYPFGKAAEAPVFWQRLPGLKSLMAQAAALIWPDPTGPPTPGLNATLVYGRELVLRTANQPNSRLLVSPGTSPP